ncbi:autophagy-related protein 13-like [Diadema setosum]|uniref:autophagy-related protein 13-like n=1 Tax=Diadema setosum TaxID=31175 RepID=UPI003B3B1F69
MMGRVLDSQQPTPAQGITEREERDLRKFTKFLALKAIQVIVQARTGEKIETRSKSNTDGTDWFNLAIPEKAAVKTHAKKLLATDIPRVGHPLNVEITLETAEGDKMILETWSLMVSDACDPNTKIHYTVYNRMGLLLKSLICIARVTPAYRISRRQALGDYRVLSRVFFGETKQSYLGESSSTIQIGSVPTPMGTISMNVAYRTKLTLSAGRQISRSRGGPVQVKDDHYSSSPVRKGITPATPIKQVTGIEDSSATLEGSQDYVISSFSTTPPDNYAFPARNEQATPSPVRGRGSSEDRGKTPSTTIPAAFDSPNRLGPFASPKNVAEAENLISEDIPFGSLLQEVGSSTAEKFILASGEDVTPSDVDQPDSQNLNTSQQSNKSSQPSDSDDFVMVDLNPAFAKHDSSSDLVAFCCQFQQAPPLELFDDQPTLGETLINLPQRLAEFKENEFKFDAFVAGLQRDVEESSD